MTTRGAKGLTTAVVAACTATAKDGNGWMKLHPLPLRKDCLEELVNLLLFFLRQTESIHYSINLSGMEVLNLMLNAG